MFAGYFASRGAVIILMARAHRRQGLKEWEWFTVSGVTGLIVALVILSGLPGPFTWLFGVLLGVGFMFDGSAYFASALASDEISDRQLAAAYGQTRAASAPLVPMCEDSIHVQ